MKARAAIWSIGFVFGEKCRADLKAHGLDEQTVEHVEGAINYVKQHYATNLLSRKERRELPAEVQTKLADAAAALARLDPSMVMSLEAHAYPDAKRVPLAELKTLLDAYAQAAGRMAEFAARMPKSGPDATELTHLTVMIGDALRANGIKLDDSSVGPFVAVTKIVFAALNVHKKDARNNVRNALKYLT